MLMQRVNEARRFSNFGRVGSSCSGRPRARPWSM